MSFASVVKSRQRGEMGYLSLVMVYLRDHAASAYDAYPPTPFQSPMDGATFEREYENFVPLLQRLE